MLEYTNQVTGLGVEGDAHQGVTVKHRSRVARDPTQPNLRQVHLPTGARLRLGDTAVVELTGLRNPCQQLDTFQAGLMAATLDRDANGSLVRKAGVMAIVLIGGEVRPGDPIHVDLPDGPVQPLQPV